MIQQCSRRESTEGRERIMADRIHIDLQQGVVPISQAAASLAELIKRARSSGYPVVITQKGYAAAVLIDIELFERLRSRIAVEDAGHDGSAERIDS
jgi:prevent-host-death family protein